MKRTAAAYFRLYIAAVFSLLAAMQAAAFTFTPMSTTIAPSGAQSVMTYVVNNDSGKQIAVAIKVATRIQDFKGIESNVPVENTFLVFPSRVVVPPNSSQNIKIQYKGSAAISTELAFRVIAEQLPIDFSDTASSGVNIMLRYIAALYVSPAKATPDIKIVSAVGKDQESVRGLEIIIKNIGTRHALVFNSQIRISKNVGSTPVALSGDTLKEIEGQNILANSTRQFFVPWPAAELGATYEGAFSAEYE